MMSQDDATSRIESYLSALRRLKETSSRREVLEREMLLAVLAANQDRLAESPSQDADRANLVNAVALRAELQPAHEHYRDWMAQFLAALSQYDVAVRTGAADQSGDLIDQIRNLESLLCKCLQGYIILSGVVRDEFNDVIILRFGEGALADLDELTHAGFSDDHYWKALLDRFVFGFMNKAFAELLEQERFKLSREGAFVAVRFPLDAILEQMPGTDKQIDKTRLQAAYDAIKEDPLAQRVVTALIPFVCGQSRPMLHAKASRQDCELLGRVASMDPSAGQFVDVFVDGKPLDAEEPANVPDAGNPERKAEIAKARKEFLVNQLLAMSAGTALALGILRDDLGKAIQGFTAKEQEKLLAVFGIFEPASLAMVHTLMLEFALCRLLTDRIADEGGKVQVKCLRNRRTARSEVEALAARGFNRIRQKVFFDDDPASPDWLYFKAKTGPELAEALKLSNIGPELSTALTVLWNRFEFKVEAVALVNLSLVAKATQNVQARLTEILTKLGVVKTPQAQA